MEYKERLKTYLESPYYDEDYKEELRSIEDEAELEDRFYTDLAFGTAGIRGKIGAGSNRINKYVIRKVTQGYANYLLEKNKGPVSIAIAYDSRRKSPLFAKEAALTLAANGIKVYLFKEITTTPELSFAVRHLKATGGIVITASHNPPAYNGYKLYDETGCQLLPEVANAIVACVDEIKSLGEVKRLSEEEAKEQGLLSYLGEDLYHSFYDAIKKLSLHPELIKDKGQDLTIVFTPLHGTGGRPVIKVLTEMGFGKVVPVEAQMKADENFTTVPLPNPEEEDVFELAKILGQEVKADLLLATDPDADRVGALVYHQGRYQKLNGNQMGALMTNYLLSQQPLAENSFIVNTIVTSHLADAIASKYGVEVKKTLTGFKYIGQKITASEQTNEEFILGFEESYGYMSGYHVRDKDAVNAALLISEMALFYKDQGKTLFDVLTDIYEEFGVYLEEMVSITLEGKAGLEKIKAIMKKFKEEYPKTLVGKQVKHFIDYEEGMEYRDDQALPIDLPKAKVLKFILEDGSWYAVRPSGTEPKLKIYMSSIAKDLDQAQSFLEDFKGEVKDFMK